MKPAPICYVEIPSPDVAKAGAFYRDVFGWEIERSDLSNQDYWMFSAGDDSLMGGLDSSKAPSNEGVIIYLKVDDLIAALSDVEDAGGKIVRPRFEIGGGYGYSAVFEDPNGNHLGLWCET